MTDPRTATVVRTARVDWPQVVGGLALAAVFVTAFVLSAGWPLATALYPRVVSVAGAVLSLVMVLVAVVRALRGGAVMDPGAAEEPAEESEADEPEELAYVFQTAGRRRWLAALLWIALFVAGLALLGLYVTTFVVTVLYLRFSARASWLLTIVYAVVATAVLVIGTGLLLHVPVPEGVVPLPF